MSVIGSNILAGASGASGGYQISRSVRLRSSASAYFNRTFSTPTLSTKWTWSGWVKRGTLGAAQTLFGGSSDVNNWGYIGFLAGDTLTFQQADAASVTSTVTTTQVFRDPSAWYHIVVAFDSTQATAANRLIMYVNGVQITAFGTATYLAQNTASRINQAVAHTIYRLPYSAANYVDGYLTEANFIDGLTPNTTTRTVGGVTQTVLTELGEFDAVTGVWKPVRWTRSFGTNGFYLPFNWSSAAAYAGSFNGTSQYLTLASNAAFAPGTGDFTIEAMVNFNTTSGNRPIFQNDVIGISGTDKFYLNYDGTNIVLGRHSTGTSSTAAWTPVAGSWYHIAAVRQSGTVKIFVDGTSLTVTNSTALNGISFGQGGAAIGAISTPIYLNGSISNLRYVVGTAVYTSSFAAPTSNLTAISGTQILTLQNSTIIDNSPNAATITNTGSVTTTLQYPYQYNGIGTDQSGNTNNWTPNNISTVVGTNYDSMLDVPTQWADGGNGRGNYCTFNPLVGTHSNTYSNGNLQVATSTANAAFSNQRATFGVSSGKWYWEITCQATNSAFYVIGITADTVNPDTQYIGQGNSYSYRSDTGQKATNGTFSTYGATFTTGDIIGVEFNADAGTLVFYKNNVSQGTAFTSISGTYFPAVSDLDNNTGRNSTFVANFGQRPFAYTPPSGFKALNTLNLPTPTILKGNQYFDVVLYTGNAVQDRAVTGFGFDLDLAWIKSRNNAGSHALVNREVGGDKQLFSNLTNAEQTNSDMTNGFTTGGILVGDNLTGTGSTNQNTYTYALWGWKEGATQGFDIVTYTGDGVDGRTVSHNLGVVPSMVIVKSRSTATNWNVKHASLSSNNVLQLNTTDAQSTPGSGYIGDLNSSTTFTLKNGGAAITNVNGNGTTYVAYVFAAIAGYSAFGSYTGNGSADGPFVFTGFLPAFILYKNSSAASQWILYDTARNTYNAANKYLEPNTSDAENTSGVINVLSNGFKIRQAGTDHNDSGNVYVYAAFASNPFKNALAR